MYTRLEWQSDPQQVQRACEAELQYPLCVKPANLRSSVGISRVQSSAYFKQAMDVAAQYDSKIVVEQGVNNALEIELGVLGCQHLPVALPCEHCDQQWFSCL